MERKVEENRLFENQLLERLSRTNAYVAISAYMVISLAALIIASMQTRVSLLNQVTLFISGLITFSLTEYVVHRYLYHYPKIGKLKNWAFVVHQFHHDHPNDAKRLALPLPLALVFAAIFFGLFWLFMGTSAPFFFSGFLLGYAGYLLSHYLIHTLGPSNGVMRYLWIHHSIHHFKDDTKAYGVSSPLWDFIFQSMPAKSLRNLMKR
ncbi:MAG TPA: sterol desaturase family protein [Sunxiuqinia sp.]|nr:sterol desaturase family protein [Sunxiuqinia sp.]